jgi:hypothetical protein
VVLVVVGALLLRWCSSPLDGGGSNQ